VNFALEVKSVGAPEFEALQFPEAKTTKIEIMGGDSQPLSLLITQWPPIYFVSSRTVGFF
jgi:hypothetical protein